MYDIFILSYTYITYDILIFILYYADIEYIMLHIIVLLLYYRLYTKYYNILLLLFYMYSLILLKVILIIFKIIYHLSDKVLTSSELVKLEVPHLNPAETTSQLLNSTSL